MGGRSIQITWRADTNWVAMIVESLIIEASRSELLDMVVIDANPNPLLALQNAGRDNASGLGKYYRTCGPNEIPYLAGEAFHQATTDMIKRKQGELLRTKDFLILAPEEALASTTHYVHNLWVLVTPDSTTTSYIYGILGHLQAHTGTLPKIMVTVLGHCFLEKAVEEFAQIKKGVADVYTGEFEMVYAGMIYLDPEKTELVRSMRIPYIDCFPQDSFHGQLKRNLAKIIAETSESSAVDAIQNVRKAVYSLIKEKNSKDLVI